MAKRLVLIVLSTLVICSYPAWRVISYARDMRGPLGGRERSVVSEERRLAAVNPRLSNSLSLSSEEMSRYIVDAVSSTDRSAMSAKEKHSWIQARPIVLKVAKTGVLPKNCGLYVSDITSKPTCYDRLDLDIGLSRRKGWTLPLKTLD